MLRRWPGYHIYIFYSGKESQGPFIPRRAQNLALRSHLKVKWEMETASISVHVKLLSCRPSPFTNERAEWLEGKRIQQLLLWMKPVDSLPWHGWSLSSAHSEPFIWAPCFESHFEKLFVWFAQDRHSQITSLPASKVYIIQLRTEATPWDIHELIKWHA